MVRQALASIVTLGTLAAAALPAAAYPHHGFIRAGYHPIHTYGVNFGVVAEPVVYTEPVAVEAAPECVEVAPVGVTYIRQHPYRFAARFDHRFHGRPRFRPLAFRR